MVQLVSDQYLKDTCLYEWNLNNNIKKYRLHLIKCKLNKIWKIKASNYKYRKSRWYIYIAKWGKKWTFALTSPMDININHRKLKYIPADMLYQWALMVNRILFISCNFFLYKEN